MNLFVEMAEEHLGTESRAFINSVFITVFMSWFLCPPALCVPQGCVFGVLRAAATSQMWIQTLGQSPGKAPNQHRDGALSPAEENLQSRAMVWMQSGLSLHFHHQCQISKTKQKPPKARELFLGKRLYRN